MSLRCSANKPGRLCSWTELDKRTRRYQTVLFVMSEDKCPCETGPLVWVKEVTETASAASAASGAVAAGRVTIGYVFRVDANWGYLQEAAGCCWRASTSTVLLVR